MNEKLKDVILAMWRKRIIGAKHIPEERLIQSKISHENNESRKIFYKEYQELLNKQYFIRLKKRTGKGSDWHISLNPEMIEEIHELIRGENET